MTKRKPVHNWIKVKTKAWPGENWLCSCCNITLSDFHWEASQSRKRKKNA